MLTALQGFLCCDKPVEMTSRDLVNVIQKQINVGRPKGQRIKVGHTGTLDPLAAGVLVVAIGSATRLTYLIGEMTKRYDGTFRLNASTASGDLEGDLTRHHLPLPTGDQLRTAAAAHVGDITQTPPAHSAIHIDGRRAYERIRAGETVTMPTRTVRVESIGVTNVQDNHFDVDVVCGGGTYMRSLGKDIAIAAGNIAVMTRLVRTAVGPFVLSDAVDIETLRAGDWHPSVQPLRTATTGLPQIFVDDEACRLLANGSTIPVESTAESTAESAVESAAESTAGSGEVAIMGADRQLRAIAKRRGDQWKPVRVFQVR